jgi:triacylglycerol lipase
VTPLEWADDASSEVPEFNTGNVGGVGAGFWGVYSSMTFCDMAGGNPQPNAAAVIVNTVKTGTLWVAGHSLGAALATYLTADLTRQIAGTNIQLKPYFFASPRPGTQDYADNYQNTIAAYDLVNYVSDLVPNLPSNPPFYTLNGGGAFHNVHTIPQGLPGAPAPTFNPLTNLANNHSPITYALMLDQTNPVAQRLLPFGR